MLEIVQKDTETPYHFYLDGKLIKDEEAMRIMKILFFEHQDWNKQAENLMNGLPANDQLPDKSLNQERE